MLAERACSVVALAGFVGQAGQANQHCDEYVANGKSDRNLGKILCRIYEVSLQLLKRTLTELEQLRVHSTAAGHSSPHSYR